MDLEKIDLKIGEILDNLQIVANELRQKDDSDLKIISKNLAFLLLEIWNERDKIYSKYLDIKCDLVKESAQNLTRFNKMETLLDEAFNLEQNNNIKKANESYKKLIEISEFGYFKLQTEAVAFRTQAK